MKTAAIIFVCFLFSCTAVNEKKLSSSIRAKQIIDSSVLMHGGKAYDHMDVSFFFRNYQVRLANDNGNYNYSRTFTDSLGNTIKDELTNNGFARTENNRPVVLSSEKVVSLSASVNSIAYFALLPYKLLEPAVLPDYLGEKFFLGVQYYKIAITFAITGAQNDHQDDYCYWINKKTLQVDFISYKTGGPRFRKAIKRQMAAGIIWQDYENYAMEDSTIAVQDYDQFFTTGKMKLLSTIENTGFMDNTIRK